jgi:alkanesulfonate monooxygenase SsuD/methylene tetrahydromethanopterin reductase-like flavin-dependent oxidoreductase (luciferase family)
MRPQSRHRLRDILDRIRRLFRREPDSPDDPYALVGAPKKPRPPYRRAAAAEPLE